MRRSAADFLLLAPTLNDNLESPALEDVLFFRDEVANVAWAVEGVVPSELGRPLDRHALLARQQWTEAPGAPARDPLLPTSRLKYVLATKVFANWFPMAREVDSNLLHLLLHACGLELEDLAAYAIHTNTQMSLLGLRDVVPRDYVS